MKSADTGPRMAWCLLFYQTPLKTPPSIGGENRFFSVVGSSPTEEAFDKNARGAMHTKREGKAL